MTNLNPDLELERLNVLQGYSILDTPPDGAFDRITSLATQLFKVPISIISLVDEDRIWFKSRQGLEVNQIPRSPGLCASAIFSDEAYVVKNAIEDPRALANPLVAGEMGLRFYAAAPLVTHDGYRLGTLNIIDFHPREFGAEDETLLKTLASLVMDQMDLRLAARKTIETLTIVLKGAQNLDQLLTICAWTKKIRLEGEWFTFEEFLEKRLGLAVTHGIHPDMAKQLKAEWKV